MVAHVALLLALILVGAKLGGEVATRLRQPPVLGELLVGMLLGNLPFAVTRGIGADPTIDMLAQLGALILLFEVGLESTVRDVLAVGVSALRVAALGTIGTFAVGWLAARLFMPDASNITHAFVAAAITATSVGITARVFKDLGMMRSREARTILGAAVLDDIFGLLVLAVVTGYIDGSASSSNRSEPAKIAWIIGKTAVFLTVAVALGMRVAPRIFASAARLRTQGALLAAGLSFCFVFAWVTSLIGLAPIIGAFAAGLVLEDLHSAHFVARGERPLAQLVEPISSFLVPLFFVVMGTRADVHAFAQPATLMLAFGLMVAAIIGKLACALGPVSGVNRLAVAFGMTPRGEVTLIFAGLGMTLQAAGAPVLGPRAYSALVTVVVLTTLLTPPALKWSFARKPSPPPKGAAAST